jgi:hypothetical protein
MPIEEAQREMDSINERAAVRPSTSPPTISRVAPSTDQAVSQPKQMAKQKTVRPIAEWQGYVTRIEREDGRFFASMDGIFGAAVKGKKHDAVIPLSEVSPEDLDLVREGAYFRLSVAYAITRGGTGTSKRQSTLVFRRLPAYRADELENLRDLAGELVRGIRLE